MRWFSNAVAAGVGKGTVKSESDRSSRKASDAKRRFDYAKREKDMEKKLAYMAEGMSNLAQSVEHVSNTTVPLAKVALAASLLAESIQDNLDNQTKDIVKQIKS